MMAVPEIFIQHTVTVEPWLGIDGYGRDQWGTAFTLECFVEDTRRMVRAADGSEVVSESTVYADPGPTIPARSRVTLPSGRESLVIIVKNHDLGGLDEVPEHLEIACE